MRWSWILGSVLVNDSFDKSNESIDCKFPVCSQSGVPTAYNGRIQDACLCVDWYWNVLGELRVVSQGTAARREIT
jgi:hypothetical protein